MRAFVLCLHYECVLSKINRNIEPIDEDYRRYWRMGHPLILWNKIFFFPSIFFLCLVYVQLFLSSDVAKRCPCVYVFHCVYVKWMYNDDIDVCVPCSRGWFRFLWFFSNGFRFEMPYWLNEWMNFVTAVVHLFCYDCSPYTMHVAVWSMKYEWCYIYSHALFILCMHLGVIYTFRMKIIYIQIKKDIIVRWIFCTSFTLFTIHT